MGTAWLVRERYRHAARIAAVLGAFVGIVIVLFTVGIMARGIDQSPSGLIITGFAIILATTLGPTLVVGLLGRRAYRREVRAMPMPGHGTEG